MSSADASSPCFVVAYDGSPASHAALAHARRRAGDGGRIVIVHAGHLPSDYLGWPNYQQMLDETMTRAERVKADLQGDPLLGGVDCEWELLMGDPAEVVTEVARTREADGIVLGSRGLGRARALLGSVAHDVLHLADRPVTVIPERALEGEKA